MINKTLLDYVFNSNDNIVNTLQHLLDSNREHFIFEVAIYMDSLIEFIAEDSDEEWTDWIYTLSASKYPLPRFLYAKFIMREEGKSEEAIKVVESIIDSLPKVDPFFYLFLSRILARNGNFIEAGEHLKRALLLSPRYSFYAKSEKLLHKILESKSLQVKKTIKLAILGSSTTSFLVPVLRACCFKDGIGLDIYEGVYGNFQQEIMDSKSGLHTFNPDLVMLLLNHRDIGLSPLENKTIPREFVHSLQELWSRLQDLSSCHILQLGFDVPQYSANGFLDDTLQEGQARIVNTINQLIADNMWTGISLCDMNRIALNIGNKFDSDIDWSQSRQYPSFDALPLLGMNTAAHIRSIFGYSAKVLILDLDNTLWGGIIGEDGLSGINIDPSIANGEGYIALQKYAKDLKNRGILLAICSKNNFKDAQVPFERHKSMILKLDDFIIFKANWKDKASNIEDIAQELSLGLDSIVFIDDNPIERSWVRSSLPDVIVPECGDTPWEMLAALRSGMYFESVNITKEDVKRHESYKSNLDRKKHERKHKTMESFLEGLEMLAVSTEINPTNLIRATQLINKTNQFNLTTRRYSEEQVKSISESLDYWTRCFYLKDKFGDNGLIGIMIVKKLEESWHIDTFLMSCRVLGRTMEKYMMAELMSDARSENIKLLTGEFIPTKKNALVKNTFKELGFKHFKENIFSIALGEGNVYVNEFIKDNQR